MAPPRPWAFYPSGEQAAAQGGGRLRVSADSPIFRPRPPIPDVEFGDVRHDSFAVKAIRLYEQLLVSTRATKTSGPPGRPASGRLVFGYNKAVGEERAALYKAALKRFVKSLGDHHFRPGRYHWANVLKQENESAEAHDLGRAEGPGGLSRIRRAVSSCYNLLKPSSAKRRASDRAGASTPWPGIQVNYRNLTKVPACDWSARTGWRALNRALRQVKWFDQRAAAGTLGKKTRPGLVGRSAGHGRF